MSLRSGNIPSLIQGVSQQPDSLRLPTQLELMENCYASVVEGLIRRPPTEYISKVSDVELESAFMHIINRDVTERYNAIISETDVQVFTVEGEEKAVVGTLTDSTLTLLTDAVSVVNGATYNIAADPGETFIDFVSVGITTATVKLQGSVNGTDYSDLATRFNDGTTVGVAIGANVYLRGIVSEWTAGTITLSAIYRRNSYLSLPFIADTPKSNFAALTVADFTFIVNKTVIPALKADLTTVRDAEGLVFVRQGNYASRYVIYIDGTVRADFTTSATVVGELATEFIADALHDDLVAWGGANFTFTRQDSTIHIVNDTDDFVLQVGDSQGGASLKAFKDFTARFTDLPATAPDGFVIGIDANPDTLAGAYYLEAVSNQVGEAFGEVTWTESVAPGIQYIIDPATMPHALIRQIDGSFTFEALEWTNRIVGDEDTNGEPSFIGSPILAVGFYKNRLGFLADEFFIFSETSEYFNFWRTTVTQILDTDPIDSRAVHTKVSILKHMVPFNTDLILFSDQTQFKIPGDVAFTPKTFRCDPVSEFEGNMTTQPVNAGKSLYFMFNREDFAGMKNLYQTESIANVMDAEDLTAHTPAYIPAGVFRMTISTLEGITCLLTDGKPSSIFVYKTAFNPSDNKKVQSAWFEWPMGDADTVKVLDAGFIESILYILVQRDGKVYQERMLLQPSRVDAGVDYMTCLDRRFDDEFAGVTQTYFIGTNSTLFEGLPYEPVEDVFVVASKTGDVPQILDQDADSIEVLGDYSVEPMWFGDKYLSRAQPSTIFVRKQSASGGLVIDEASRLQLLRGYLNYSNSGHFTVSVTPEGRSTSDYIFTGRLVGDLNPLGEVALGSGRFSFAILSRNDRVILEFSSDEILPFRLTSMEWEGTYTKRSQG